MASDKKTGIKLQISAVDSTARAFKNIAKRAASVTASVAKWGAAAAVGAGAAFLATAKHLGNLSDVAAQAGSSVKAITQLSNAMDQLGVKGGKPEELAAAFQKMTKETGEVGVEGFYNVVDAISQLPTVQERATAAQRAFGRTGLQYLPLIEAAQRDGIESVKEYAGMLPHVSDEAAQAGDAVADAFGYMTSTAKGLWDQAIGGICEMLDGQFDGGIRAAAVRGSAHMIYWAKYIWRAIKAAFDGIKQVWADWSNDWGATLKRMLTIVGKFGMAVIDTIRKPLQSVFEHIINGAMQLWARLTGDDEWAEQLAQQAAQIESPLEAVKNVWKQFADDVKNTGIISEEAKDAFSFDTSDIEAERDKTLAHAKEIAELNAKMSKGIVGGPGALGASALGSVGKKQDPSAILGGSYKAITYAMRRGYGTVQDKIAAGVGKANNWLQKIAQNTEKNGLELEAV